LHDVHVEGGKNRRKTGKVGHLDGKALDEREQGLKSHARKF